MVPAISPGRVQVLIDWPAGHPLLPATKRPFPPLLEGETLNLTFGTRPTVGIRGRVILAETGQPLRGADIVVSSSDVPCDPVRLTTDARGNFSVQQSGGLVTLRVHSIGDDPLLQARFRNHHVSESKVLIVPIGIPAHDVGDITVVPYERQEPRVLGPPVIPPTLATWSP